jgi:hypothetical protein
MSTRKFYKRIFQVEVLSEDPIPEEMDLDGLHCQITDGEWSGVVTALNEEVVDGARMAELLIHQGSDPGFFRLTDKGEDDDA